jgi:hypothetical protein
MRARGTSIAIRAPGSRARALVADGTRAGGGFLRHVADFDAGVGVRAVDPAVVQKVSKETSRIVQAC